jgi:hypothetical protein
MFVKHFKKSVATATAVGAVLAVAATTTSGVVTAAPEFENVACTNGYPNPSASNTNLTLTRPIQQYGQRNRANVTVTANGKDGTGKVRISAAGNAWTVVLQDGEASVALPRTLDAEETYTVRARYIPDCAGGEVAGSNDAEPLTVGKADTKITSRFAPNIKRGEQPRVRAIVSSTVSPGGSAKVIIFNGKARKAQTVRLNKISGPESSIFARFSKTYKRGQWTVKIKYLGTGNFDPSREFTGFVVKK